MSCSTLGCALGQYPRVEDATSTIRALGFRAADLVLFEGWQHVDPSALVTDGDRLAALVDVVMASGVRISSLNCGPSVALNDPDPAAFEQYVKEYRQLLNLAESVECPNITLQPGKPLEGQPFSSVFDRATRRLSELAALGEGREIGLSVEGHHGSILENPRDGLRMMEALWPTVGFTYDPSHFVMQDIPLQETEPLLAFTMHVHVRNASLGKMQDTMACGSVDFRWLVSALRARGYTGALSIEYFNRFDERFESTLLLRDLLVELGVER